LIGVKRNQQTRWRGANKLPPHINVGDTEIGDTELLYEPGVFPDETRHHILAEMLRVDDKEMPWRGSRSARAADRFRTLAVCSPPASRE
jgi:hypothetical protein